MDLRVMDKTLGRQLNRLSNFGASSPQVTLRVGDTPAVQQQLGHPPKGSLFPKLDRDPPNHWLGLPTVGH